MPMIDFHAHVYPDRLAERATRATCDFYGLDTPATGSVGQLLARGGAAGISQYVLLPVAVQKTGVRHVNDFIVQTVRDNDAFYGFGTVHPDMEGLADELAYIRASGLRGVKLHPDMQSVNSDDERLDVIYDFLSETGLPLLIHCGDRTRDFSHPRRLRRALDRHPRMTVVAAHLGGWSHWDEALESLCKTDCYLDMSSCAAFMPPQQLLHYIRAYGASRILFGTDFPVGQPDFEVRSLLSLPLNETELAQITHQNAKALLGVTGSTI